MKNYVYWKNVESTIVDDIDIEEKVAELQSHGALEAVTRTAGWEWLSTPYVYKIDKKGKWTTLFFGEEGKPLQRWMCNAYKPASEYQKRKEAGISSQQCRNEIVKLFKKYTGSTLCKAFKPVSSSEFKDLVPKPLYYVDENRLFQEICSAQYIDVSSMYPGNARGRLPDAHTAVTIQGYAKPSEEFPFAFYLKSHHCAEYGVFDTHDYLDLPMKYYRWQNYYRKNERLFPIYKDVADEDEITVLMQPSEYELTEVFEEINRRKMAGDKLAKAISNVGIGTLHKNPDTYNVSELKDYYHIAAIVLGRSNKQQYDMIAKLESNGYVLLQGIVDSLIYVGEENYGTEQKVLGEYYNEFHGTVKYRGAGINRYVIYNDNREILKCVVSGVDEELQDVKVPEDIDKYKKVEKQNGKKH